MSFLMLFTLANCPKEALMWTTAPIEQSRPYGLFLTPGGVCNIKSRFEGAGTCIQDKDVGLLGDQIWSPKLSRVGFDTRLKSCHLILMVSVCVPALKTISSLVLTCLSA